MSRPRKGSDQDAEKALTRTICQHVHLASGLTFAALDEVFGLGEVGPYGRKTGRTFLRYCESDPAKSRAASRDNLSRIVRKAVAENWLSQSTVQSWGLHRTLAMDHKMASEFFEERKKERDQATALLRQLRSVTEELMQQLPSLKHVFPAQLVPGPHGDKVTAVYDFKHSTGVDNPAHEFYHVRPPASLYEALDWLQVHLDQTVLMMHGGWLDPVAEVSRNLPPELPKPAKKPLTVEKSDCDMADIDQLLLEVEKWCKSGAPVTENVVNRKTVTSEKTQ